MLAGCEKEKSKCERVAEEWQQLAEGMEKFAEETGGGSTGKVDRAAEKADFIARCRELPAEDVDCLRFERMLDDECREIKARFRGESR